MYASSSFVGYSLWLVPTEPARSTFQTLIDKYSADHGTVKFEPHVTLIAGLDAEGGEEDVLSRTEKLASELSPLSAQVTHVGAKDLYFQSVFAMLEKDHALLEANKTARKSFGQDPSGVSEYMPHVSLLYGDLPMDTRGKIRQDAEPAVVGSKLELDWIQVWCTQGPVSEWRLVKTFPLQHR